MAIIVSISPFICTHEQHHDGFMLLFSPVEETRGIVSEHGRNKRANALMQQILNVNMMVLDKKTRQGTFKEQLNTLLKM